MISKLLLVYTGELVFIDSLLYIDFSLLNVIICTYCDQIVQLSQIFLTKFKFLKFLSNNSTFSNFCQIIQLSQNFFNTFQCTFSICSLNFFLFLNLSLQILHTCGCIFSKCLFKLLLRVNFFSQN